MWLCSIIITLLCRSQSTTVFTVHTDRKPLNSYTCRGNVSSFIVPKEPSTCYFCNYHHFTTWLHSYWNKLSWLRHKFIAIYTGWTLLLNEAPCHHGVNPIHCLIKTADRSEWDTNFQFLDSGMRCLTMSRWPHPLATGMRPWRAYLYGPV